MFTLKKNFGIVLFLVIILAVSFGILTFNFSIVQAAEELSGSEHIIEVGDPTPKFSLIEVSTDKLLSFPDENLGKKVVIINVMQTACSTCKTELQELQKLAEKYKDKLKVFVIAVDSRVPRVKKYVKVYKFPFTFISDPAFSVPAKFGFSYTPCTVFIDLEGKVAEKFGGFTEGDEKKLEEVIKSLIKK